MRFGLECPPGFLPVFSVRTADEARSLLVATCPRNDSGAYISREMAAAHQDGTRDIPGFARFGDKLATFYWQVLRRDDPDTSATDHRFVESNPGYPAFAGDGVCARCRRPRDDHDQRTRERREDDGRGA